MSIPMTCLTFSRCKHSTQTRKAPTDRRMARTNIKFNNKKRIRETLTIVDLYATCKEELDIQPLCDKQETQSHAKARDVVRLWHALPPRVIKVNHVALWRFQNRRYALYKRHLGGLKSSPTYKGVNFCRLLGKNKVTRQFRKKRKEPRSRREESRRPRESEIGG